MITEKLKCPGCNAPADINTIQKASTKPMLCRFCNTVYTVRESQDTSEKLKKAMDEWLGVLLPAGSAIDRPETKETVDHVARHHIFCDKLYPSLKMEAERCLAEFESLFELPLFHTSTTLILAGYLPPEQMISEKLRKQLKALEARVSSRSLQDFVVVPEDKVRLIDLQTQIQPLLYYINIIQHLAIPSIASYKIIRENLLVLEKEYKRQQSQSKNMSYSTYLDSIDHRLCGAILFLDVLIEVIEASEKGIAKTACERAGSALAQLHEAEELGAQSTYDPFQSIPLLHGIQKDIVVGKIVLSLFHAYEIVTRIHHVDFTVFCEQLKSYIEALAPMQSPEQQLALIDAVNQQLAVHAGDKAERFLNEWSWLNPAIEKSRKVNPGSKKEKVQQVVCFFHPCWVARLNGRQKTGLLKSSEVMIYVLVDASTLEVPCVGHRSERDAVMVAIETNPVAFADIETASTVLPVLLPKQTALQSIADYVDQHTSDLGGTNAELVGIIYLPVASIELASKNGSREVYVSPMQELTSNIKNILLQSELFLRHYTF